MKVMKSALNTEVYEILSSESQGVVQNTTDYLFIKEILAKIHFSITYIRSNIIRTYGTYAIKMS